MATTIHLPPELLARVDSEAQELGISRNRYIRDVLEAAVSRDAWSPAFLSALDAMSPDPALDRVMDEMEADVLAHRKNKPPPTL